MLINPNVVRRERQRLRLTLDQLAKRSQVNKSTLHRIEQGKLSRNAEHVVERLAKVLQITVEQLTADDATADDAVPTELFSYRSQLSVRFSHEARNALALVAARYDVKPLEVLEVAPLLFHLLVTETLAERARRLDELQDARERIADLGGAFPHITERLVSDWNVEEIEHREARSIAAHDWRGRMLDEGDDFLDPRPLKYDDGKHNPFVAQLRARLSAVQAHAGAGDQLESWDEDWSPRYEILREEALAFVAGDDEAAEAIIEGRIGVHEIPKELRGADCGSDRAGWIKSRAAEVAAANVAWLETIGVKDLLS